MSSFVYESVEQFSKVLAQENIVVSFSQTAKTASFNMQSRVLTLPVWDGLGADAVDMLVAHEVGHALYTPCLDEEDAKAVLNRVPWSYVNIMEDVRIDKKMQKEYAGLRQNYRRGYRQLHETFDLFALRDVNVNELILADRINLYSKLARYDIIGPIEFNSEENALRLKAECANTWAEVVEVAIAVYEYSKKNELKQQEPEQNQQQKIVPELTDDDIQSEVEETEPLPMEAEETDGNDEQSDEGETQSEGSKEAEQEEEGKPEESESESEDGTSDGDTSESESGNETEDETSETPSKEEAADEAEDEADGTGENSDTEEADDEAEDSDGGDSSDGAGGKNSHVDIETRTVDAAEKRLESLAGAGAGTTRIFNIAPLPLKTDSNEYFTRYVKDALNRSGRGPNGSGAGEWWDKKYAECQSQIKAGVNEVLNKIRAESKKQVQMMVKRFQQKQAADRFRRTEVAKKGDLDANRLWSYRVSDDLFAKAELVKNGQSHGMVMLLDGSGSMGGATMANTLRQLYALTSFCDSVKIPYEVHMFFSSFDETKERSFSDGRVDFGSINASVAGTAVILDSKGSKLARDTQWKLLLGYGLMTWAIGTYYGGFNVKGFERTGYHVSSPFYVHDTGRYELKSTPLDYALLSIDTVIKKFQKVHGVQKVHLAVLTDGDSDPTGLTYLNESAGRTVTIRTNYSEFQNNENDVINDTVSKKTFKVSDIGIPKQIEVVERRYGSGTMKRQKFNAFGTAMAVKILKLRLPSVNVIGFYLVDEKTMKSKLLGKPELLKEFRKGFLAVNDEGFDEYYYVKVDNAPEKALDEVDGEATTSAMTKAFVKSAVSDSVKSAFLNRFIDLIV